MNEIHDFLRAAVAALPVGDGVVLLDSFATHNPDFFDQVVEIFGAGEEAHLRAEARRAAGRRSALRAVEVEGVRVLGGAAFDREHARRSHRVAFAMAPLLARDGSTGLLVVQIETASARAALAVDHWVLMQKDARGAWRRVPVPPPARDVLFLTRETGG